MEQIFIYLRETWPKYLFDNHSKFALGEGTTHPFYTRPIYGGHKRRAKAARSKLPVAQLPSDIRIQKLVDYKPAD